MRRFWHGASRGRRSVDPSGISWSCHSTRIPPHCANCRAWGCTRSRSAARTRGPSRGKGFVERSLRVRVQVVADHYDSPDARVAGVQKMGDYLGPIVLGAPSPALEGSPHDSPGEEQRPTRNGTQSGSRLPTRSRRPGTCLHLPDAVFDRTPLGRTPNLDRSPSRSHHRCGVDPTRSQE